MRRLSVRRTAEQNPPDDLATAEKDAAAKSVWLADVLDHVDLREALTFAKCGCDVLRLKRRWYRAVQQRVELRLDLERLRVLWVAADTGREKELPLTHVKELLPGEQLTEWARLPASVRALGLELLCNDGWRLRLVFANSSSHRLWGRALLYALSKTLAKRQRIDLFEDLVLLHIFRSVDTDRSGSVQLNEVLEFLKTLELRCDVRYVANLFFSLTDDESCVLEVDEFLKFMATLLTEDNLVALFNRLTHNSGRCVITEAELRANFFDGLQHKKDLPKALEIFEQLRPPFSYSTLLEKQLSPLMAKHPPSSSNSRRLSPQSPKRRRRSGLLHRRRRRASLDAFKQASDIVPSIMSFAPQFKEGGLTVYGFCQYIMSDSNSVLSPEKWDTIYQDMNLPLAHYWVKTCAAPLDLSGALPALDQGLMLLNPGRTVKEEALQLRLHRLAAALVQENFRALLFSLRQAGGLLFCEAFDGCLISLEAALSTIATSAFAQNPYPVTLFFDTSHLEPDGRQTLWTSVEAKLGAARIVSAQDDLSALGKMREKFLLFALPPFDPSPHSSNPAEGLVDELFMLQGFGDLRDTVRAKAREAARRVPRPEIPLDRVQLALSLRSAAELAAQGELVAWPQGLLREAATDSGQRKEIIAVTRTTPTMAMAFMGFGGAQSEENAVLARTLGVTYIPCSHLGSFRTGSSGFGPLMDTARFRVNGGVGYVAKPKSLVETESPKEIPAVDVDVEVLSVRQVPRLLADRALECLAPIGVRVVAGIDGVEVANSDAAAEGVYSVREQFTDTVLTNGLTASFTHKSMTWTNVSPNVSIMTFAVDIYDSSIATFVRTAWAALPVNALRAGFRWVPLWDRAMRKLEWSGILVRINCRVMRKQHRLADALLLETA